MVKFTKMHGIGNDFVIIDNKQHLVSNKSEFARKICNRHTGVGADGLILLYPSDKCDVKIEIFNSDGSEAYMCGNGVRCVCKYIIDNNIAKEKDITIETKSGIKHITYSEKENFLARVDMGEATFCSQHMPLITDQSVIYDMPLKIQNGTFNITCVYIGNLHTVIFVDNLWLFPFEEIALQIQKNRLFYESTNVEFVEIVNDSKIKMRVFERGCGETLGCGTGACAAVYTCIKMNKTKENVTVELPGGTLSIHYNKSNNHIYLKGPAETTFIGEF